MTKEECTEKIKFETDRHKSEIYNINKEYAFSNNTVNIGDIIKNRHESIIVEKIQFTHRSYSTDFPECCYTGLKLTKKGVPFKSKETSVIYQLQVIEDK